MLSLTSGTSLQRILRIAATSKTFTVLWGTFLLFLTAQIYIPLEPVPITLSTFGVMLIGLTFERKTAIQSMLTYLSLGAIGLPVFAGFSGGYGVFLRATGGYLIGFLMAIMLMTTIREYLKRENLEKGGEQGGEQGGKQGGMLNFILISLLGSIAIYSFGILGLLRFMDLQKAIAVGFMPFIIPGLVKIFLLSGALKYIKSKTI